MAEGEWDGIIDIEPSKTKQYVLPDGRKFWDSEIAVTEEWKEELRLGYRCINCFEPLHKLGAFPAECPVCHFPVKEHQLQVFTERYLGVDLTIVQPGVPLEREFEAMERETFRPKGLVTMSIPRKRRKK